MREWLLKIGDLLTTTSGERYYRDALVELHKRYAEQETLIAQLITDNRRLHRSLDRRDEAVGAQDE